VNDGRQKEIAEDSLFPELDGSSAERKMHFPCTNPKDKLPSTHKPTV